jgi:hypothetical protein
MNEDMDAAGADEEARLAAAEAFIAACTRSRR